MIDVHFAGLKKQYIPIVEKVLENGEFKNVRIGGLVSYLDGDSEKKMMIELKKEYDDFLTMIDSGAHTFIKVYSKVKKNELKELKGRAKYVIDVIMKDKIEDYVKELVDYVAKYEFDKYVELDIPFIGIERLWKLRKIWGDMEPIIVYHGEKEDERHIREVGYRNVGIGGLITENFSTNGLARTIYLRRGIEFVKSLKDTNVVHWFAMFDINAIKELYRQNVITSIDATTWMLSRYGMVLVRYGDNVKMLKIGDKKKEHYGLFLRMIKEDRDLLERYGIDYERLKARKICELDSYSLLNYLIVIDRVVKNVKKSVGIDDWLS